jgi:hypothetical protein
MVNENYSNKKIIAISGAGPSAVTRWKKQYLVQRLASVYNLWFLLYARRILKKYTRSLVKRVTKYF